MSATYQDTISIAQAARQADDVHPNTVRDWIRRGYVDSVLTPLGKVVVRESLEEFLRARSQDGDSKTLSR